MTLDGQEASFDRNASITDHRFPLGMLSLIRFREELYAWRAEAIARTKRSLPRAWDGFTRNLQRAVNAVAVPYINGAQYHRFLPDLIRRGVFGVPGDVLEIGAFVGVGTSKLACVARKYNKKVFALDVFQLGFDFTKCMAGVAMNDYYSNDLGEHSLWALYEKNTRRWRDCIVTVRGDTMHTSLPPNTRLCFAFIDGNHDPAYVRHDFETAWSHLSSGGVLGLDDYGFDLPQDTATIDRLMEEHSEQIATFWRLEPKQIFMRKR